MKYMDVYPAITTHTHTHTILVGTMILFPQDAMIMGADTWKQLTDTEKKVVISAFHLI